MDFLNTIQALTPTDPAEPIDWDALETLFGVFFSGMRATQQDPVFHAEGDVYTHTQLVCRALTGMPAFHALPQRRKTALFLAAVLHDVGKTKTTRLEDGSWTSPHHGQIGSLMARTFLWQECALSGTPEIMQFRETVCAYIRYHMLPLHLTGRAQPERQAREVASLGKLIPDYSWELLCMLAEADVRGRIASDTEDRLADVQLSRWTVEETGCLSSPYGFADAFSERAYLSGRLAQPQPLYDDTWGEVILMCGLPGTGKDTWIRDNVPHLPVVSLDDIRRELGEAPDAYEGRVKHTAQARAQAYLRQRQPFVWNATNLKKEYRQGHIRLFEQYGARVRIVYLETDWAKRTQRNLDRPGAVPESVVERMLSTAVPPAPSEAQTVEWITT